MELSKLRVVDLKQRLSQLGLPVGGLKADLVTRLHEHLLSNDEGSDGSPSQEPAQGDEPESEATPSGNKSEDESVAEAVSPKQQFQAASPPPARTPEKPSPVSGLQSPSVPLPVTHRSPPPSLQPPPTPHSLAMQFSPTPSSQAVLPSNPQSPTHGSPSSLVQQSPLPLPPSPGGPALGLSSLKSPPAAPPLLSSSSPIGSAAVLQPTQAASLLASPSLPLDADRLMQEKVRQQQLLLQQQKSTHEQEELFRLQQQAMIEKQKEESEKQAQLLRLQQEALKQNEDEQKQLQALGLKPPPPTAAAAAPADDSNSVAPDGTSSVAGVGALLAALQRQPPPSVLQQSQTAAALAPPPGLMGAPPSPLLPRPPPPSQVRPIMAPRPQGQVGLMGHSPAPRPSKPPLPRASPSVGRGHGARTPPEGPRHPRQQAREDRPPPLMSLQVSAPPAEEPKEVRLPQALEEALAYKHQRAKQVGVSLEEHEGDETQLKMEYSEDEETVNEDEREEHEQEEAMEFNEWIPASVTMQQQQQQPKDWSVLPPQQRDSKPQPEKEQPADEEEGEEEEDEDEEEEEKDIEILSSSKLSKKDKLKKKRKKKKKKKNKLGGRISWIQKQLEEEKERKDEALAKKKKQSSTTASSNVSEANVDVQYVQEEIELDFSDPLHRHFAKIFENFKISDPTPALEAEVKEDKTEAPAAVVNLGDLKKVPKLAEDTQDDSDNEDDDKPKVSKRKMKLLRRMSIAELKQTVNRPDVVEMHDVTARDPKLLVHLKATRNTVSVPRHWCFKRKYLQGKRGIEKPPFELPDFIKRTGIMEMRAALQEKEDQKTLKAKMRDKVRPKMGKIDIDYQKLHDAFFKWQSKPEMTIHGDLYYEGKEFETKMKDKKPGEMSDDLRIALGMPVGANAHKVPPPWLIAMQRYGPPPSYPNLKIPGLNAPIPDGCSFGYHAGGWGKPPVDNMGKPIYGDVFGTQNKENEVPMVEEEVEKSLWGELESESEEESEEEESSEEEEDQSGLVTPGETGLVTPSGISSMPAGLETPDMIELRKKHMETEAEGGETPALYTVLPERRVEVGAGRSMMASTHTYDISSALGGSRQSGQQQGVEVALDPSELDLVDTDAMAARYEATLREQQTGEDEDFSDMVAEHAAKQRNKRRRLQHQEQNKPAKKYKDFKF